MEGVRSLADREVDPYREWKGVVAGWEVQSADSGRRYLVLIDGAFPFSKVQIACVSEGDRYLQWPHVEEHGFLCLPAPEWLPCEKLGVSAQDSLQWAEQLISCCQSQDFVRTESQKEFVSYWARHSGTAVRSLIDVAGNRAARIVCARKTGDGFLVGESSEQLDAWSEKNERFQGGIAVQAVFAFIEDAPSLPFPQNSRQFFDRFIEASPEINKSLAKLSPFRDTLIVLASFAQGGIGLWGAHLRAVPLDGFRPTQGARANKAIWRRNCLYVPGFVSRVDGSWVHGRGRDVHYSQISQKHVVVLGAGSLGSQVAARLAQAGVGRISIVDPQALAACNVGRHELGMGSLDKNKAEELARLLSEKYPHGDYSGVPATWQAVLRETPELFEGADLVVCCMGETPQDLAWSAHHQSGKLGVPSLYGWLGTQGATGHALLIAPSGPGLSCFIDPGGYVRRPDTEFSGGDQLQAEPGCGTEFQPYGPLAAGEVEVLVSRLAIDFLSGKVGASAHRIRTCSTEELSELGGEWTKEHGMQRPEGYEGPLQYELPVTSCGECYKCTDGK
tara:strand:+ start:509 stop:2188 length:1680 start_codon:yes stop_codon:yes gene_type:complete